MPINPEAVKELRRRLGLSQNDLAGLLKLTPQQISNYELGKCGPTVRSMDRLYEFALENGIGDIQFYVPPKKIEEDYSI